MGCGGVECELIVVECGKWGFAVVGKVQVMIDL